MLYPKIVTLGVDAVIQHYREIKTTKVAEYSFAEGELNELGYRLMRDGDLHAAIVIFKLNLEIYPTGNSHDSLAKAYLQHGERDFAISHYKRSLELDPQNKNAQQALTSLTHASKPVTVKPVATKPATAQPVVPRSTAPRPASAPAGTPAAKHQPC